MRRRVLFANDPAIPVKNFDLARRTLEILRKNRPDTDMVTTGKEPRENVPVIMNACDVLILTSLYEGSPMVIKEAMACNLPIVSTDVGDVREITGGTANCFVASRSPAEMAARMVQIFDSGRRTDGRERIGHLDIDNVARRILEVYKEAR